MLGCVKDRRVVIWRFFIFWERAKESDARALDDEVGDVSVMIPWCFIYKCIYNFFPCLALLNYWPSLAVLLDLTFVSCIFFQEALRIQYHTYSQ